MRPAHSALLPAIVTAVFLSLVVSAAGQTLTTAYRFTGGADGANPAAGLIADSEGNLYGTTSNAHADSPGGTIFELSPSASGTSWTFKTLFTFTSTNSLQGSIPLASLLRDAEGNLYGTTSAGGGKSNCGTVFKLSPPLKSDGKWGFTLLHTFAYVANFKGLEDGCSPVAPLIMDASGNLYGTTLGGGNICIAWNGCSMGVVFELSPAGNGGGEWAENIPYRFGSGGNNDGANPAGGVVFGKDGWLYGTTLYDAGFGIGIGTVFGLEPPSVPGGAWTQHIVYNFPGGDNGPSNPTAGVVFDSAGNLYGTTTDYDSIYDYYCEYSYGVPCGHIFEMSPPTTAGGTWTYSSIYSYTGGEDLGEPLDSVTLDARGNLYVTAYYAGGSVIELNPPAVKGDAWTETTLYQFTGNSGGGYWPLSNLVFGPDGRLYGTLYAGGNSTDCSNWAEACGTIFALTPQGED